MNDIKSHRQAVTYGQNARKLSINCLCRCRLVTIRWHISSRIKPL